MPKLYWYLGALALGGVGIWYFFFREKKVVDSTVKKEEDIETKKRLTAQAAPPADYLLGKGGWLEGQTPQQSAPAPEQWGYGSTPRDGGVGGEGEPLNTKSLMWQPGTSADNPWGDDLPSGSSEYGAGRLSSSVDGQVSAPVTARFSLPAGFTTVEQQASTAGERMTATKPVYEETIGSSVVAGFGGLVGFGGR